VDLFEGGADVVPDFVELVEGSFGAEAMLMKS
jgi:hypothetical protein